MKGLRKALLIGMTLGVTMLGTIGCMNQDSASSNDTSCQSNLFPSIKFLAIDWPTLIFFPPTVESLSSTTRAAFTFLRFAYGSWFEYKYSPVYKEGN